MTAGGKQDAGGDPARPAGAGTGAALTESPPLRRARGGRGGDRGCRREARGGGLPALLLPSAVLPVLNSFSLSLSLSTWSLKRCTGQWLLLSVMSCRLESEFPSSLERANPLSKTSLYVIVSFLLPLPLPLLLSLLFWSKDLDTKAVSSSMAAR